MGEKTHRGTKGAHSQMFGEGEQNAGFLGDEGDNGQAAILILKASPENYLTLWENSRSGGKAETLFYSLTKGPSLTAGIDDGAKLYQKTAAAAAAVNHQRLHLNKRRTAYKKSTGIVA